VRIADPRMDNGVRLAADQLPGRLPAAVGASAGPARPTVPAARPAEGSIPYGVMVYRSSAR